MLDYEYIRYLMLYSDEKHPFEKAKSDPGLFESVTNVNRYMDKHGESRKLDNAEAKRILLQEKQAREKFRLNKRGGERDGKPDRDEDNMFSDFTPKAENQLNEIENKLGAQSNLENEVAMLRKALQDKEAELKARLMIEQKPKPLNKTPMSPRDFGGVTKSALPPDDGKIIERKLEDTGYSDKINK